MSALNEIKIPVSEELEKFEGFYRKTVHSDIPLLNFILNYVIRTKGKQIRPLFVFLSAKMHGEIIEDTFWAATAIELLHSASLIHDDVIDDSYERRGAFSINALWKNKIAVLTGDFLLAKGLLISIEHKEYEILNIVSSTTTEMVEGELIQFNKSRKLDIDEATYFEIIKKKTASLIGTSMAVGARSVIKDQAIIERMREIGILAGLAFQIRDDIFDYQEKGIIGKPTGNDIKEKKITLPLIHVLNNSTARERRRIINIVQRNNHQREKVDELIELVRKEGGIEYATEKMNEFSREAQRLLKTFPPSEANSSMIKLIDYIISRKK
jgi:octaprenyl-diphosphate synthase